MREEVNVLIKRLFSVFLVTIICFALAACSYEEPDDVMPEGDETDDYSYEEGGFEVNSEFGSFESVDLYGNTVTDEIFANADVTVVNVWGTFCGPCIGEMPDLKEMADNLPANAQLVGMVIDAAPGDEDLVSTAIEICDENGISYTNILASDSVMDIMGRIAAVPTTFILDSEGKLVCDPIVGADVEAYKNAVSDYLG